ncbi:TOF1 [Candida theae]|uniref:Topoisomerase 1-associated factor 1 n=1 Tax=Candida theae TaxID=1198502 RepID=A0AAD5BFW7_9ASCO|nr:TOF1 [Candida theae]KAI5958671.1 TOF1 [Candida theae]
MSDVESGSDVENYYDAEELDDFIDYSDEEVTEIEPSNASRSHAGHSINTPLEIDNRTDSEGEEEEEEEEEDKIKSLTTRLKPNETHTQKLLRAHIAILVSALGGIDHTSEVKPPPYKLGHDALACLKDIKRWIRAVDEKQNNYEVALACAECGLIQNDIIVILCQWEQKMARKENIKNKTSMEKIMLSCLEILVLLTWPVDFDKNLSENQKLLYANIRKIHVSYKKHILTFNNGQLLKAVIRLVLPVLQKSKIEREPRENQILRLVLYLIRNVLAIEPVASSVSSKSRNTIVASADLPSGVTQDDISINNVLKVFKKNKVLSLLLTISGSINVEFDKDLFGEVTLECVYLMIKGIEAKDVLVRLPPTTQARSTGNVSIDASAPVAPSTSTVGMQLSDLLATEAKKKQAQTSKIATRHGKFGTLLSIRSSDATSYVVSGEEALADTDGTLDKLDKSKTWKTPNHFKYDSDDFVKTSTPIYLTGPGRQILHDFVDEFLSGGCFNNLIEVMASKLTSQSEYSTVDELSNASYFYTIAWFLNYKREQILLNNTTSFDFGSVRAALSEVNFILIVTYFRDSFAKKSWNSLHVAMICFKELLQISNSIFGKKRSTNETDEDDTQYEIDRELAEGIIRKLFSFNDFLNILVLIPQSAFKHSPRFLKQSIHVITIILKSFESFAREDLQLYVQTKRKQSRQNRKRINELNRDTDAKLSAAIYDSDDEAIAENIREVTRERRLNFQATEVRFFHQAIVTAYIEYLWRFQDLNDEDIKMCLSYFHKLFVVRKDYNGLFRLDFMQMIHKLKNHLPRSSSIRLKVEEFIYYFMKKFKLALGRFPNIVEVLFPRIEESSYKCYLSTGELYEKEDLLERKFEKKFQQQEEETDKTYRGDDDDAEEGEADIAFELEANPNSSRQNGIELDQLDELEAQLNSEHRPRSKNLERGKAHKRKSKSKNSAAKVRDTPRAQRRGIPAGLLEESQPTRSAEFVHDSDDDSDDERHQEFFAREERLRKLLNEIGSITNNEKLEEFKKVWSVYSKNGDKSVSDVVNSAVEKVSLFVQDDDDDVEEEEDEDNAGSDKSSQTSILGKNNGENGISHESEAESYSQSAQESEHTSDTSDVESDTIKRARVDDDHNDEQAQPIPARKKRLVISDDEDY